VKCCAAAVSQRELSDIAAECMWIVKVYVCFLQLLLCLCIAMHASSISVLLRYGVTACSCAAAVLLQSAEPLLERHMHPTVLVRGYTRALEDAIKVRAHIC